MKKNLFERHCFTDFPCFELACDLYGSQRVTEQCGTVFFGVDDRNQRHLLFFTSQKIEGSHSSLMGELMALHRGLDLIIRGPWLTKGKSVSVFSDGKTLVDLLNNPDFVRFSKLDIRVRRRLSDILEWTIEKAWDIKFRHVDSVMNSFADFLSRKKLI